MKKDFLLTVTSPDGQVCSERISSLTVRGKEGEITILSHHAPLLSSVLAGRCRMTLEHGEERVAEMSEGILSVQEDEVTLICQNFHYIDSDNKGITF